MDDFSVVGGEPHYRLIGSLGRRTEQQSPRIGMTVVALVLLTWLPLLILAALQNRAVGGVVRIPFLWDFAAYTRLLLAVPILVVATVVIDRRLRTVALAFINTGLVTDEDRPRFMSAIEHALRLRGSVPAEALVVLATLAGTYYTFNQVLLKDIPTWQIIATKSGPVLSMAGWWFVIVCAPIYLFLLFRWVWRLLIWYGFLWRMNRLDLRLIPTHPDLAGGLGFISLGQTAFGIVVLAAASALAGSFANRIIYAGAPPAIIEAPTVMYVIVALVILLAPLLMFTPKLIQTKRQGIIDYGKLATGYTQDFDDKWVRGRHPEDETILGSQDIQALADLSGSYQVIGRMRIIPFGVDPVLVLIAAAVIPMLPVVLASTPVEQTLKGVVRLLSRIVG